MNLINICLCTFSDIFSQSQRGSQKHCEELGSKFHIQEGDIVSHFENCGIPSSCLHIL